MRATMGGKGKFETVLEVKTYDVPVKGVKHQHGFNGFFPPDGSPTPLCKEMQIEGCDAAVAATSWSFTYDKVLYAADGTKSSAWSCKCDGRVLVPALKHEGHGASGEAADSLKSFLNRTAEHERGHFQTCESLKTSVAALVRHLPDRVPRDHVAAFNQAFVEFCEKVYVTGARKADIIYDVGTDHGGKYWAAIGSSPEMAKYPALH